MKRLADVTKYVRSKNAGPFWVTIDIFFKDHEHYHQYKDASCISAERIAAYYEADPKTVKVFKLDELGMIKISLPRKRPQGGALERDMHSGQQYVRLLDINME